MGETMSNLSLLRLPQPAQVDILHTTQPRNFANLALRDELETQANLIRAAFGNYVIDIYDELTDFNNNKAIKAIYNADGIVSIMPGIHTSTPQRVKRILSHLLNYEVFRSTEERVPYDVTRTVEPVSVTKLNTWHQYYYKVRTVDFNGTSDLLHCEASGYRCLTKYTYWCYITATNFTSVSLVWNSSTDNVAVGYSICKRAIDWNHCHSWFTWPLSSPQYATILQKLLMPVKTVDTSTPVSTTTNTSYSILNQWRTRQYHNWGARQTVMVLPLRALTTTGSIL